MGRFGLARFGRARLGYCRFSAHVMAGGGGAPSEISPGVAGTVAIEVGGVMPEPGFPAGYAAGDVFFLAIIERSESDASVADPPPGGQWDFVAHQDIANDGAFNEEQITVYRHVYDGVTLPSAAVPAGFNHTVAAIIGYSGVDNTTPLDAAAVLSGEAVGGTSLIAGGVTTVSAGAMVVAFCGIGDDVVVSSPVAAGLTGVVALVNEASTEGSDGTMFIMEGKKALAGASGDLSATLASSKNFSCITLALRPAS